MTRTRPARSARVTYRRTTVADVGILTDHRHRMWTAIGGRTEAAITEHDRRYRTWATSRLRSGELIGVIAEASDGTPVGSGLAWFRPDQPYPQVTTLATPYILSMYTLPEWRGRGIASGVVRRLVADCRARGSSSVALHASRQGRPVYRRFGFDRTWEMRFWIDPRIRRQRARAAASARKKGKKGLGRAR